MTVHTKTCINAVRTPMRLFRQETRANAPRCEHEHILPQMALFFFPNAPSFLSQLFCCKCWLERFFRTYLTFGKNRSLLLAEQEVGPNCVIADLEVVTNVRDIA